MFYVLMDDLKKKEEQVCCLVVYDEHFVILNKTRVTSQI